MKVVKLGQINTWENLLQRSKHNDVFFSQKYLSILAKHLNTECVMYWWGDKKSYILYPVLKRELDDPKGELNHQRTLFDIVSPWYYGGLLQGGEITKENLLEFHLDFQKICNKENIISNFSRINPYLNDIWPKPSSEYVIAKLVYIDLTQELDKIFNTTFNKRCRTAIRKSIKENVRIHVNDEQHLKAFQEFYTQSMIRKRASEFYFFPYETLVEICRKMRDHFLFISIEHDDKIVGGSIFLYGYGKMYYFLSARDPKYDVVNSLNRSIYEAIQFAQKHKLKIMDLGGGGGNLFRFKKSFSNTTKDLYAIKEVYDYHQYEKNCAIAGKNKSELLYGGAGFFPEYRDTTG